MSDGGSAFPRLESLQASLNRYNQTDYVAHMADGMSLRDYFAAHAPVEPWSFFQPEMSPRPVTQWHEGHPTEQCFECIPENWQAQADWDKERTRQRVIQWPWFYADVMLAERARKAGA
jgi:hypothetical protein